jgi:hypothetical protein
MHLADADRASCPRCGARLPAEATADHCPHCTFPETRGDESEATLLTLRVGVGSLPELCKVIWLPGTAAV